MSHRSPLVLNSRHCDPGWPLSQIQGKRQLLLVGSPGRTSALPLTCPSSPTGSHQMPRDATSRAFSPSERSHLSLRFIPTFIIPHQVFSHPQPRATCQHVSSTSLHFCPHRILDTSTNLTSRRSSSRVPPSRCTSSAQHSNLAYCSAVVSFHPVPCWSTSSLSGTQP